MAKDVVRGEEENTLESSLEISFTMVDECMHIGLIASLLLEIVVLAKYIA